MYNVVYSTESGMTGELKGTGHSEDNVLINVFETLASLLSHDEIVSISAEKEEGAYPEWWDLLPLT